MTSTIARFAFKSPNLDVEFEGAEEFVVAQLEHFKAAIERELRPDGAPAEATASGAPAPASTPAPAATRTGASGEPPSLEEFYRRAKSREGRGALQETILIFAYFLRDYRSKDEFSIENLNACFALVGVAPPRSLANTLGVMKRNQRFFHSGSRRGHYTLTEKGAAYVQRLIGAA